jgi:hypothetical protein
VNNYKYNILSSWNQEDIAFPHQFIIEFELNNVNKNIIQTADYSRTFNNAVKELKSYLNENFGYETKDWAIAKFNGNYNWGSSLILGFRNSMDAAQFYIMNV